MLELVNISRIYKQKKGPSVKALDNVSITFDQKGMVFILGKSGSGKSTLLNVIGGLDKYTSGDLIIKGKSTKQFSQSEFDSYRNTMVGFIFQEYNILDEFTVGQNIGIALELQGKKATSETIDEYLSLLGMQGFGNRKPNTLSGGQKQRVAIARALVKNPDIIMADEPTGALDSVTGKALFETLKKLSETKLLIIVTHDHEFAETYGDRIIEFQDGQIIRDVYKTAKDTSNGVSVVSEKGISLEPGYQLTPEDVIAINDYLLKIKDHPEVKIQTKKHEFLAGQSPTPYPRSETLDLIKSKLPFMSALKMGASALKHKRFRLIMSILLSSTAFTMFGLTDTMASFNQKRTAVSTMTEKGLEYSNISKILRSNVYDDEYYEQQVGISQTDLDTLNTDYPDMFFAPFFSGYDYNFQPFISNTDSEAYGLYTNYTSYGITTLATADLPRANLTITGRLPLNNTEIAIPEYIFEVFKAHGYKHPFTGVTSVISVPSDLFDKPFVDGRTIKGVVKTGLDLSPYQSLLDITVVTTEHYVLYYQLVNYLHTAYNTALFFDGATFSAIGESEISYVMPLVQNFSASIGNQNHYEYVRSFEPLAPLSDSDILYLYEPTDTIETLGEKEVVISYSSLYANNQIYRTHLQNAYDNVVESIVLDSSRDAIFFEFVKAYHDYEVTPYTTWTSIQKETYRGYYAKALLQSYFLYESNFFEPDFIGKTLLFTALLDEIDGSLSAQSLFIERTTYGGDISSFNDLSILGFVFDYENIYVDNEYYYPAITLFVGEEVIEDLGGFVKGVYDSAIVYHGSDRVAIQKIIDLSYQGFNQKVEGVFYRINNSVVSMINTIGSVVQVLSSIFVVIGTVFAVFAALLFINFITLSVAFKKQEIGILRAIGARGFDVSSIFMNEAGIIACINFVISIVGTFIFAGVLNRIFKTQLGIDLLILVVGIRQIGIILLIAFGVASLASFLPVYRISRKKPIDAIKDR